VHRVTAKRSRSNPGEGTKTFSPQRHRAHKVGKSNETVANPLRFGGEFPRPGVTFPIFIEYHTAEMCSAERPQAGYPQQKPNFPAFS